MAHDDPVVFEHIGDTYSKLNRVPQAMEAWQKAMALDPQNKQLAQKIENTKTTMSKGAPAKPNPTPITKMSMQHLALFGKHRARGALLA